LFVVCCREQAQRDEEAAAARAVAAARDRERVQFRDAEFQQKRSRAAAAAREEEEEERRRAAALQALADTVAPTVEADPRRVLQVFWFGFCFVMMIQGGVIRGVGSSPQPAALARVTCSWV
jgi:pyruvate-formate lyase